MVQMHSIKVKVLDIKGSYVSIKYMNSNARTRIKKEDFMADYEKGVFNVVNPDDLNPKD